MFNGLLWAGGGLHFARQFIVSLIPETPHKYAYRFCPNVWWMPFPNTEHIDFHDIQTYQNVETPISDLQMPRTGSPAPLHDSLRHFRPTCFHKAWNVTIQRRPN